MHALQIPVPKGPCLVVGPIPQRKYSGIVGVPSDNASELTAKHYIDHHMPIKIDSSLCTCVGAPNWSFNVTNNETPHKLVKWAFGSLKCKVAPTWSFTIGPAYQVAVDLKQW